MAVVLGFVTIGAGFVGASWTSQLDYWLLGSLLMAVLLLVLGARQVPLIASLALAGASFVAGCWLYSISGDPDDLARPTNVLILVLVALVGGTSGAALALRRGHSASHTS